MSQEQSEETQSQESKPQNTGGGRGIEGMIDRLESHRDQHKEQFDEGSLRGQRTRSWTEKLVLRTATGVTYAVSIIVCLYFGVIPTSIIVAAMAWLCCSEFFRMARKAGRMPNEIWGLAAALAYPLAVLLPLENQTLVITSIFLIGCAIWYVATPRANIADVAITAFGPIYTSLAFSCLVYIRGSQAGMQGFLLCLGVMGSVWLNDSCAYLVGSRIGKHKLAPRISPNKSVEGFWGGIVASMLVWLLVGILGVEGLHLWFALLTGAVVAFCSVVGDLFESRIKRGVGVKDSGDILPGHGGLLDRSDSMLFGGMAAYVLLHIGGIL